MRLRQNSPFYRINQHKTPYFFPIHGQKKESSPEIQNKGDKNRRIQGDKETRIRGNKNTRIQEYENTRRQDKCFVRGENIVFSQQDYRLVFLYSRLLVF